MLKIISWILVIVVIIIGVIAIGSRVPRSPASQVATSSTTTTLRQQTITIGDTQVSADVADTDALREQGLSGRPSLAPGSGMWFVFDQDGTWGFWMKDMTFPIDIIWVNAQGMVVTVAADVSPSTYFKENPPQVFYPSAPAHYVLEVPAGFARAHRVVDGSLVTW